RIGGIAVANNDRLAEVHADCEPMPFIAEVVGESLVEYLRENIAELQRPDGCLREFLSLLVEVEDVSLQLKQFHAEQSGSCLAGVGVFLDDPEKPLGRLIRFSYLKPLDRAKLRVQVNSTRPCIALCLLTEEFAE